MLPWITIAMLLLQLLSPTLSYATASASVDGNGGTSLLPGSDMDDGLAGEIEAFGRAKVSAGDSIAAFEKRLAGAKVVDLGFDGASGKPAFRIKAVYRGEIWTGAVDSTTGDIFDVHNAMPVASLANHERSNIADLAMTGFSLSDVVVIAETSTSAKALSVGLDRAEGRLKFLAVVFSRGALRQVSIEPDTKRAHRKGR